MDDRLTKEALSNAADRILSAWNSQDPNRVAECYDENLVYRDPGSRGPIFGREALLHYLKKVFAVWEMQWSLKDIYLLEPTDEGAGVIILSEGRYKRRGGDFETQIEKMELAIFKDEKIIRNEIFFDFSKLKAGM